MDQSRRQITKIAREVSKFTVKAMKAEGIGTAEFDFIHLVLHPSLTTSWLGARIVKFRGLSDDDGSRTDNQYFLYIASLRHGSSPFAYSS